MVTSQLPLATRLAALLAEAQKGGEGFFPSETRRAAAPQQEPAWYHSVTASKIAADLQRSEAIRTILQEVGLRDQEAARAAAREQHGPAGGVADVLASGKTLTAKLQSYADEVWTPDLRSLSMVILRIVHPDTMEQDLRNTLSDHETHELFESALVSLSGKYNPDADLFLQFATKIFVWRVKTLLDRGLPLEEISERQERIVENLEYIRWMRYVRVIKERTLGQTVTQTAMKKVEFKLHEENESFEVFFAVAEKIYRYAEADNDPCFARAKRMRMDFAEMDELIDLVRITESNTFAQFKSGNLKTALEELVDPLVYLANIAVARVASAAGQPDGGPPDIKGASTSLNQQLEYVDSAVESYKEWLMQNIPRQARH